MNVDSVNHKKCCGCAACMNICPKGCICLEADGEGFLYPIIDLQKCVHCGRCYKVCQAIDSVKEQTSNDEIYAAKALDSAVALSSSSGGIFTLFAEQILREDGVVYGAVLSDDCYHLFHARVDCMEELDALKGSKYFQSQLGMVYKSVKKDLKDGKKVLFSGTPCQVNGLAKFLGTQYDNLFTLDLICHGVPSQKLWETYLRAIEDEKHKVAYVNFRNKKYGWKYFSLKLLRKQGKSINSIFKVNPYMQMMLNNVCLRPSCYDCDAKGKHRAADITLGDFWGVKELLPEMSDGNGTSVVLVNTWKGKRMFERISCLLKKENISLDMATKYNPCLTESVELPKDRERFYYDMKTMGFKKLAEKYAPISYKSKIISVLCKLGLAKYLGGGNS